MRFSVTVPALQRGAENLRDTVSKLSVLEETLSNFHLTGTLGDGTETINARIRETAARLSAETANIRAYQEALLTIISSYENAENANLGRGSTRQTPGRTQSSASGKSGSGTDAASRDNEIDEKIADEIKKKLSWNWKYSRTRWVFSSPDKRKQIIRDMLAELAPIYGITAPSLTIGPEEDPTPGYVTGGYFDPDSNSIWINEDFFEHGFIGRDDAVHTLLHEMRHAYQYDVINHPENYDYDESTVNQWRADYYGYISAEDDFDAYDRQPIETDADGFADRIQTQDWWY